MTSSEADQFLAKFVFDQFFASGADEFITDVTFAVEGRFPQSTSSTSYGSDLSRKSAVRCKHSPCLLAPECSNFHSLRGT